MADVKYTKRRTVYEQMNLHTTILGPFLFSSYQFYDEEVERMGDAVFSPVQGAKFP